MVGFVRLSNGAKINAALPPLLQAFKAYR